MTYQEIIHRLSTLYDAGEARAIVRMVFEERFHLSMADVLCGKVSELSADDQQELQKIIERLAKAEPVQYVLGEAVFCGKRFHVEPGVLIPRPETEELCQWVLGDRCWVMGDGCRVLDIGTGSGCIAITLAAGIPDSQVTAWDISERALNIARENANRAHIHVSFEQQDILKIQHPTPITHHPTPITQHPTPITHHPTPITQHPTSWHLIVSNPPYIYDKERETMTRNVIKYEPHEALFAPDDAPERFYQAIGQYAFATLTPGGRLYLELNPLLTDEVRSYLHGLGFSKTEVRQDQFGKQRFIKAVKP